MRNEYPEFRDWSIAAVRLLQGVVELEDGRVWDLLLSNIPQIEQYFARMGLQLVIDELTARLDAQTSEHQQIYLAMFRKGQQAASHELDNRKARPD